MNCPDFLDDEGRREWWALAADVFAVVGATAQNAERLGRYVALYVEWRRLTIHNNEHDLSRMTRKGRRLTAEYIAEQKLQRRMHPLMDQLGMSPLARAKLARRRAATRKPGA
jgi:P27 family predicted phage terminase small subunit